MKEIDMTPNDDFIFDTNTFYAGIRDPSVFDLPSTCDASVMCPTLSICTGARLSTIFA